MLNRIKTEPVLVTGLARALILCVTAFGLKLSAEQIGGIMLVLEAVLSLVTRASVSPVDVEAPDAGEGGASAVTVLLVVVLVLLILMLLGHTVRVG